MGPWGGWSEGVVNFQVVLCDNPLELEGEQYTVGKHFSNSFHPPYLKSAKVKGGQTKHERSISRHVVKGYIPYRMGTAWKKSQLGFVRYCKIIYSLFTCNHHHHP